MNRSVVVLVRNDAGQILILEQDGKVRLPGRALQASESLVKVAAKSVNELGLEIGGLSQIGQPSVSPTLEVYGFQAYVLGGRLKTQVSWVTPSLALKLRDMDPQAQPFLEQVKWV